MIADSLYFKEFFQIVLLEINMLVILRKIPSNALKNEIISFLEPALNYGFWGLLDKKAYISNVEIVRRRKIDSGKHETDAVLRIEPDKAALRLIRRFNGKRLNGKSIVLRVFHLRTWRNDRRQQGQQDVNSRIVFKDRRKMDRRNSYEIIISRKIPEKINPLEQYVTAYSAKNLIDQAYTDQSKLLSQK
jgi:RNA recognition motif-containing protein